MSKIPNPREATMVLQLEMLNFWIPERMKPGDIAPLEAPMNRSGEPHNPYLAVLSCPRCGLLGLISRLQLAGVYNVICGSNQCSAEYFLDAEKIVPRKPM